MRIRHLPRRSPTRALLAARRCDRRLRGHRRRRRPTVDRARAGRLGRGGLLGPGRTTRAGGASSRIRCSSSSRTAALDANRDVRSAMARLDQARAVFDEDRRAALSDRDGRRLRRRPRAGAARVQRRAAAHQHLSRRLRRVLGARSLRPGARGDRRRLGQRRELRGRARRACASASPPTWRGTTSSCAASSSSCRCSTAA